MTDQTFINLQQPVTSDAPAAPVGLDQWLSTTLGWDAVRIVLVERPAGGGSANETLLIDVHHDGTVDRLVVRRAGGTLKPYRDTDLARQARTIAWVRDHTCAAVPDVLAVETSPEVLGGAFMLMRRIDGVPAPDYPGYNVAGFLHDADVSFRRELWTSALDMMSRIHLADASSIDFLPRSDSGDGLVALLADWRTTADWVGQRCDVDRLADVLCSLAATVPMTASPGLSWGDARIANMLFDGARCSAVLDWEMASLGGPLVDLAWWLMFDQVQSEDLGVERLAGLGDRSETIDCWQRATGLAVHALAWHEVLAHVQLALTRANVFAQRGELGLPVPGPDDPRSVERLARRLEQLIDGGALS